MADENVGVPERPKVGEDILGPGTPNVEPGRAIRDGERPPPGGNGDDERGGRFDPVYFF